MRTSARARHESVIAAAPASINSALRQSPFVGRHEHHVADGQVAGRDCGVDAGYGVFDGQAVLGRRRPAPGRHADTPRGSGLLVGTGRESSALKRTAAGMSGSRPVAAKQASSRLLALELTAANAYRDARSCSGASTCGSGFKVTARWAVTCSRSSRTHCSSSSAHNARRLPHRCPKRPRPRDGPLPASAPWALRTAPPGRARCCESFSRRPACAAPRRSVGAVTPNLARNRFVTSTEACECRSLRRKEVVIGVTEQGGDRRQGRIGAQ